MITLYGRDGTGSDAPRMLLLEMKMEHEYEALAEGSDGLERLKQLNKRLQVPVLDLEGHLLTESTAICLALCELEDKNSLLPAAGTLKRAEVYRWLSFAVSNIYESYLRYYYPDRFAVDAACVESVKSSATHSVQSHWQLVEQELQSSAGEPWWFDEMGVLDIYYAMLADWSPDRDRLYKDCPRVATLCQSVGNKPNAKTCGIAQPSG